MTATNCFLCGCQLAPVVERERMLLGVLRVTLCGPCNDLPDTEEVLHDHVVARLAAEPTS